jgi:putative two-component system response regulator
MNEIDITSNLCLEGENSSYLDYLTLLYNHSALHVILDHEEKRFNRYGTPFSLLLVDVDNFSLFNENNSYLQGDIVLKEIAQLIRKEIRESDIPTRYSGDQYIILLKETNLVTSAKVAERIRFTIENSLPLTVSVGLVGCPSEGTSRRDLINKAQLALEQAKIRGKNKIYYFTHDTIKTINGNETISKILIVDDTALNLKMMEAMFPKNEYFVVKAQNGIEALHTLHKHDIDLVLLDVMMPEMDGYTVCRRIKLDQNLRMLPVILITAFDDTEAKIKGIEAGADDFIVRPPNKIELLARVKSLVNFKKLTGNLTDIKNILLSLANAVEAKDRYTHGHVERVANLAVTIGKKMQLSAHDIESLWFSGVLHDIGKIGIPDAILNKEGKLNEYEWNIMKSHPNIGYKICLPLQNSLGSALTGILNHHEKLDGSGYPNGLKNDSISIIARIIAVVDNYDALSTDRPYRKALSNDEALNIIMREAQQGKFDMDVVEALINIILH